MNTALNRPAEVKAEGQASGLPKQRILVVDDDRLVLATVVQGLLQAGYEVIDADNGDDAILLARQHRPHLALLDIRMEGKSGFDVAQTLRDVYSIPFMFLSAFSDAATLAQVKALGAQAYLTKPLDVGQIVPSVTEVLLRLANAADAAQTSMPAPKIEPKPEPAATGSATRPVSGLATERVTKLQAEPANAQPHWDAPVSLAVGVLMHRHGLLRQQAWAKLHALAQGSGRTEVEQAERLLLALEELAQSGPV